jgi:Rieske 2Fe-2S family protein
MSAPDLQSLLLARRPGRTLDRAFYTDQAVFDAELDLIFGRHWVCVGVEPDVPEPGDVMVVDIGPHSAIVVRHDDGGLRAYHNVCRHRGARLVEGPKSTVGNIVCRYHQWTYDLDGALIFADHMPADFDRSCLGLKPVHLRSLGGLLFLCFAATPPDDFDFMAAQLTPYVDPHALRQAKVAAEIDLIEEGNWKLTMENNRECYHCAVSHPELTVSLFEHGFGFAPDAHNPEKVAAACRYETLDSDMKAQWEADGLPSREVAYLDGRATGFRAERLPLDGAGESQTLDTRRACRKLLGSLRQAKLGGLSLWTQPNGWNHFMADHIVTFVAFPMAPGRTLVRTKWLVHRDAVEGRDYDVEKLTAVWRATNEQDAALVAMAQAGVRQSGYEPGPYSPLTETLVETFVRWYVGRMTSQLCA